jgi:D-arabinose 1-dehydrogenase-like Zn-dependent alcohol dehydrogenase
MRVAQVPQPGAPFELVDRPIPEPGPREVRIKVEACGICHSDSFTVLGAWTGISYPRVPGHEIAGRIDAVGRDVTTASASASAGSAAIAACVPHAGAATLFTALWEKYPASATTAAMRST